MCGGDTHMLDLTKGFVDLHNIGFTDFVISHTENAEAKIDSYEKLLSMSLIMRANQRDPSVTVDNQEKIFPHIKLILEWLRNTDFYTSPASANNHEAYIGGLLEHTLSAYTELMGLRSVPKFKSVVDTQWWSAVFAILAHDWCKIGRYESYYKNVKNPDTGVWEQVAAFRTKQDDTVRFGHGTQSLIMAMQLCNSKLTSLSFEEMAAIRWHMDAWDIGHYDDWDLNKCNEKVPMVRMIQFADQLAITTY